eukprot:TRINITY_DN7452_c0_g1_i1.p1 TRINITY_DN7452_c0_g1~~TRINITY_DN7452_c0_g1_i1.p1  ORF type:complete len:193 (-),score=96.31 TRINITY_DN7452_c0_g1_i1:536-1069(-)
MLRSLVGSEMCIRDRVSTQSTGEVCMSDMAMATEHLEDGLAQEAMFEDLEKKINRPLQDDERQFLLTGDVLLSGDQISTAIKADELEAQKKRLKDLQNLFALIKDLNTKVHDSDEKMQETQDKVDKAVNEYIKTGTQDLGKAKNYADAIRRKKRISLVVGILVFIAVALILFFVLKK